MRRIMKEQMIEKFIFHLKQEEKSHSTIQKYLHDIRCFSQFANCRKIDKSLVLAYKAELEKKYAVASANSMLAALNAFLRFMMWSDCCVKQIKVQKRAFCSEQTELTKEEYIRLVQASSMKGNERLSYIIETICCTGIRVSELKFITVEAVHKGEAVVSCKNKIRTVFLASGLRQKLLRYIHTHGIRSGVIFITKSGKPIDRCNLWRDMKALCASAGIAPCKVFPHNLRHLFARTFYSMEKDIAKLADILGHSNINTTRIYMITTGVEHRRRIENMRLVVTT